MSGEVIHFEIPADDTERAYAFYRDAFGWEVQPMPELDYAFVTTTQVDERGRPTQPGSINGGMVQRKPDRPHPVVALDVADIDATLARVAELGGGTVTEKFAAGEMGWAAYFRDSEGNVVGLWQTRPQSG
jgi:uncharacterized protein